jgi:hypothetical protein
MKLWIGDLIIVVKNNAIEDTQKKCCKFKWIVRIKWFKPGLRTIIQRSYKKMHLINEHHILQLAYIINLVQSQLVWTRTTKFQPLPVLSLLERDKSRRVGSSNTGPTVLHRLVRDRELSQIVTNHLGLQTTNSNENTVSPNQRFIHCHRKLTPTTSRTQI